MKKFRIKIDLSAFFDDERKLVCILIDPNWESVKCLQQRVEEIFELDNLGFITEDGCFVPPQESIEVIKSSDILKALVSSKSKSKNKKKMKQQNQMHLGKNPSYSKQLLEELSSQMDIEVFEHIEKRKFKSLGHACASSTPNQAKRSKYATDISHEILPNLVQNKAAYEAPTSTNEYLGQLEKQKLNKSKTSVLEKDFNQNDSVEAEKRIINSSPELKKRKRKKKNVLIQDDDNQDIHPKMSSNIDNGKISPLSGLSSSNEIETNKDTTSLNPCAISANSHLYFDDIGAAVTTTCTRKSNRLQKKYKQPSPTSLFNCQIAELTLDVPRLFDLRNAQNKKSHGAGTLSSDFLNNTNSPVIDGKSPNNKTKEIIEIKEHILIAPVNRISESDEARTTVAIEHISEKPVSDVYNSVLDEDDNTKEGGDDVFEADDDDNSKAEHDITANEDNTKAECDTDKTELATNIVDDSSIIALDSEDEDGKDNAVNGKNSSDNKVMSRKQNSLDISEVIDLNATDEDSTSDVNDEAYQQLKEFIKKKKSIKDILPYTTELCELPSVDDVIIFKITCIDSKISDYFAGKCEYINKRLKSIKLSLFDQLQDIKNIPHKYRCILDDSVTDTHHLNIKMCDMIDPRLFQV